MLVLFYLSPQALSTSQILLHTLHKYVTEVHTESMPSDREQERFSLSISCDHIRHTCHHRLKFIQTEDACINITESKTQSG